MIVPVLCQVVAAACMLLLTFLPSSSSSSSSITARNITGSIRTCHPVPISVLRLKFGPRSSKRHAKRNRKPRSVGLWREEEEDRDYESNVIEGIDGLDVTSMFADRLSLDMISGEVQPQKRHAKTNATNSEHQPTQTPWHCEMTRKWKRMKKGIYPTHIETGRCRQTQCFHGMYECTPRKYVIHVLKKSKRKCVPLPLTDSAHTQYEDEWRWKKVKVTVGCQCTVRHGGKAVLGL